jgi:dihydroflavonol-4-reductase
MTTLVTGASGFVGAAVARCLAAAGHKVRVMLRSGSDRRNIQGLDCEVVAGDLADPASLSAAVAGCDALFHVAADYRLWVPDPAAMLRTNVDGTVALIRAASAAGVERIVYTSSVATLRLSPAGDVVDEGSLATLDDMVGTYKRSKFIAEREVAKLVAQEGAPVVMVLPTAPVGPRDIKPTPTGRVVVETATGRMPAFVDTGLNIVHVDDVAAGHLLAFERGKVGARYILGGENMTLRQVLEAVAAQAGRRAPRIALNADMLMPMAMLAEGWTRLSRGREPMLTCDALRMSKKKMYFSSAHAESAIGYVHRPATAAIADALDWFRANGYIH